MSTGTNRDAGELFRHLRDQHDMEIANPDTADIASLAAMDAEFHARSSSFWQTLDRVTAESRADAERERNMSEDEKESRAAQVIRFITGESDVVPR